ncbi:MAG TPA: GIY-YIG nuclease family protein [Candidatus Paceibacterota bacterium]
MYFTYILRSIRGKYYIGSTRDLYKRIVLHNTRRVKSTKYGSPWKLLYFEKFNNLSDARNREIQIKHWKSRVAVEQLINTAQSSNG